MSTQNPISDLRDVCFVMMPFGRKRVETLAGPREVDFDLIYDQVFLPAIKRVHLPPGEGGMPLRPIRADDSKSAGIISTEMFQHVEYARIVLADITGSNANVFFELGARYRAREAGTVVFRQNDAPIPFDINQVRAFPYSYSPEKEIPLARKLVREVLRESLSRNQWDSPVMLALRGQAQQGQVLQDLLRDAERAEGQRDRDGAIALYERAIILDPENPLHHIKASFLYKDHGQWDQVVEHLRFAVAKGDGLVAAGAGVGSDLAVAHRELGIASNKRDGSMIQRAGEESLRRAVLADPGDFDAWACLGGILKRAGDFNGALDAYRHSATVSHGHPYPVLNAIRIAAHVAGRFKLTRVIEQQLLVAKGVRLCQVSSKPPADTPWSFFDLAEILLYLGNPDEALAVLDKGLLTVTAAWQTGTLLDSLALLPAGKTKIQGISDLRQRVAKRHEQLTARGSVNGTTP